MPPDNIPGRRIPLHPNDRGFYIDDPGGPTDGFYLGTKGNVSLFDTEVEGAGNFAEDSPLEALIYTLADEAGVTAAQFANFLGRLGLLTGVDSKVNGGNPGTNSASGDVELFNARLDVGDIVNLGDGNDCILARSGNDIVFGGAGNDALYGEDGADLLFGGDGNDVLMGGADGDLLSGDDGNDLLSGGAGNDWLRGGDGDDVLEGGEGRDLLQAGDGADLLIAGGGGDNELLYLGTDPASPDVDAVNRDTFTDVVQAEASFADNGTDTVYFYSDGQDGQDGLIPVDIIDLSDTFDFSADADTAAERQDELLEVFHVVSVPLAFGVDDSGAHIRDLGGDGVIDDDNGNGDDNTWFVLNEGDPDTFLSVPEVVTVTVDGFMFEWDIDNGATSWVEIA